MLHSKAKKNLLEKTLTSIHMENKISLKRQRDQYTAGRDWSCT